MKRIITILSAVLLITLLSVSVFAEGEFEITDSTLVKYSGSDSTVYIPMDVKNISAGAFDGTSVSLVIFNSFSCGFETGAIPAGVTVKAPESSDAHIAALRDGLTFSVLDGSVNITINYQYVNGEIALPSFSEDIYSGDSYSYTVPSLDGFAPNVDRVEGIAGDSDITVTVIYSSTVPDGWSVENGRAMYTKNGLYLKDTTEEIDGMPYSFDENGYLMIGSGFLNTPSGSYYFSDGYAVTGFRVIGKSIYYFNADGTMVKGTSASGFDFDIGGNLIANDTIVTIGSDSYFMIANELYSGYRMIDGSIVYFGSDYKMVKNGSVDGLSFDASGALVSGIDVSELEISGLSDVAYTGDSIEPLLTVKFNGIILTRDVHYKLYYSDNTEPGTATIELSGTGPVSGTVSLSFKIIGDEAYTLTIRYVNVMGAPVAEAYTTLIEPGEEFDVPSPTVEGYEPDQESVSGTMGNSNITISVTYTKVAETSDTSDSTDDPTTDTTVTEKTEPDESEPAETEETNDKSEGGYNYDYSLFVKVLIIATVIAGGAIVLILNWDAIKKALSKKKNGKK